MKKNQKLKLNEKAEIVATVHTHACSFKSRGITLVSLVVTIIVLLILAGVSLYLVAGSNGILGRAAKALDKNKVAIAKEQVELALVDFQNEFFEGKYVSKTLDGEKKDYIAEKLKNGVQTSGFYAQILSGETVQVYEGETASGTEIAKGSLQEDSSILWNDENVESSGNQTELGGEDSEINEQLKNTIAELQARVNVLETEQNTLKNVLTISHQDVLFEGMANEKGKLMNFLFRKEKH